MCSVTLDDINRLKLNAEFLGEMDNIEKNNLEKAMDCIKDYIFNLKHKTGRKVRLERKASMYEVLQVLYKYAFLADGQCCPSMRTIACDLDKSLEPINHNDSPEEIKRKEKAISSKLMQVQRTIDTLVKFGIIVVHTYRSETNRNDDPNTINVKNPNFYYELVPVSMFCSAFESFIKICVGVANKLSDIIFHIQESVTALEGKIARRSKQKNQQKKEEINYGRQFSHDRIRINSCVYE